MKKHVYSTSNLIHMFCNQVDVEGCKSNLRRGGYRQIFVQDGIMFSYGFHYPMAKWHGNVMLINSEKSSPTTNGHRRDLAYGVPSQFKAFYVPNIFEPTAEENIIFLKNRIVDAMTGLLGKGKYYTNGDVLACISYFNNFNRAFGLPKFELSNEWLAILAYFSNELDAISLVLNKLRVFSMQLKSKNTERLIYPYSNYIGDV